MRNSQQEIATPKKSNNVKPKILSATMRTTYIATLIAASLVLKTFGNSVQIAGFKVSFVYITWILSALILGPFGASVVAICTDVMGTIIAGTGGGLPLPIVVLGNAIFPVIVWLGVKFLPIKNINIKLFISAFFCIIICTLGINTIGLALFYKMTYLQCLISMRLPQIVVVIFNFVIVTLLIPPFKKIKLINQF